MESVVSAESGERTERSATGFRSRYSVRSCESEASGEASAMALSERMSVRSCVSPARKCTSEILQFVSESVVRFPSEAMEAQSPAESVFPASSKLSAAGSTSTPAMVRPAEALGAAVTSGVGAASASDFPPDGPCKSRNSSASASRTKPAAASMYCIFCFFVIGCMASSRYSNISNHKYSRFAAARQSAGKK